MKECPNCKSENKIESRFCTQCGADLKDIPVNDEWVTTGDFFSKAKEVATTGARKAKDAAVIGAQKAKEAAVMGAEKAQKAMEEAEVRAAERKHQKVATGGWDSVTEPQESSTLDESSESENSQSDDQSVFFSNDMNPCRGGMLVDENETILATIGSNYLQNYLSGGNISKGIGILTQKRFYYKGHNFNGSGKSVKSTTTEGIVSLEDITFTEFTYTRHIAFLVLAILSTVATIIFVQETVFVAALLLIISILFYVLFFIKCQTLFLVSFPGGGFAFDIRWYPIADIRDFQQQLHLLKDYIKEENPISQR